MIETELSNGSARLLSWIWLFHQKPEFLDYLLATFSETINELPKFEHLCLMEAAYGDPQKGSIGGEMKRWWLVDDEGFRSVHYRQLPRIAEDMNAKEGTNCVYYRFPVIKFYQEGMNLTFGEAFGPLLACRKIALIRQVNFKMELSDVQLVWNRKSIAANEPPVQPSQSLDIGEEGPFLLADE